MRKLGHTRVSKEWIDIRYTEIRGMRWGEVVMKGSLNGDRIMLFRVSAISKSSQVKEVDVTYNDLTELPASKAALLGWLEKNKM